jgi:hypothetical protein
MKTWGRRGGRRIEEELGGGRLRKDGGKRGRDEREGRKVEWRRGRRHGVMEEERMAEFNGQNRGYGERGGSMGRKEEGKGLKIKEIQKDLFT